jgi:hypothetical protein
MSNPEQLVESGDLVEASVVSILEHTAGGTRELTPEQMMNPSGRTLFRSAWAGLLWVMMASAMAGDWPAFRGPTGDGVAKENKAPLHWGPGENIRWQAPLPGPGNSSPIVSRGRVFVTCANDVAFAHTSRNGGKVAGGKKANLGRNRWL